MESNIKLRNIMVAVFGVIIVIGIVIFGLSRSGELSGTGGGPFTLVIDVPEVEKDEDIESLVIHAIEDARSSEDDIVSNEVDHAREDVVKVEKVMIIPEDQ